jgi:hypothetical protein
MEQEQSINNTKRIPGSIFSEPIRQALSRGFGIGCVFALLIFINSSFLQDKIYFLASIFSSSYGWQNSEASQKEYKQLERKVKELRRKFEEIGRASWRERV